MADVESGRRTRVRRLTPSSQFDAGKVKSMLSQQLSNFNQLYSTNEEENDEYNITTKEEDYQLPNNEMSYKEHYDDEGFGKSVDCSPFHRQALITNHQNGHRRRSTKDSGYDGEMINSADEDDFDDHLTNTKMQPITERHYSRDASVSSDCDDEAMESLSSDCGSIENSPYSTRRRRVTPVPLSASKIKEALQMQFRGSSECMFVEEEDVEDVDQFNSDNDFVGKTINMKSQSRKKKQRGGYVKSSSFDCLRLALSTANRQKNRDRHRFTSHSLDTGRECATDDDGEHSDTAGFRPLQTRSLNCSPVLSRNPPLSERSFTNRESGLSRTDFRYMGNAAAAQGPRSSTISSSDDDECLPFKDPELGSPSNDKSGLPQWMIEAQASMGDTSQSECDGSHPSSPSTNERPASPSSPLFVHRKMDETSVNPPRLMSQQSREDSDDNCGSFILRMKKTANRKKPSARRKLTPSSTKPLNLDKLHSLRDHLSKCTLSEE